MVQSDGILYKVTLESDYNRVTCFGIKKDLEIQKGSLIHIREINNLFFEASILSSNNEENRVLLARNPNKTDDRFLSSKYDLIIMEKFKNNIGKSTFYNSIDKQYYELLVDDPTTPAVILTYIFFRFFNEEKIVNKIIKHPMSEKSGMIDVFEYIQKFGIKKFMDNLYKTYQYYDDDVISILKSIKNVPLANGIQKIITSKERKISIDTIRKSFENKGWSVK